MGKVGVSPTKEVLGSSRFNVSDILVRNFCSVIIFLLSEPIFCQEKDLND